VVPTQAVTVQHPSIHWCRTLVPAKLNGVNPEAYLKDILTKIADGIPSIGSMS
jgi:hypothetical protein